jgi:hypothetical protein
MVLLALLFSLPFSLMWSSLLSSDEVGRSMEREGMETTEKAILK